MFLETFKFIHVVLVLIAIVKKNSNITAQNVEKFYFLATFIKYFCEHMAQGNIFRVCGSARIYFLQTPKCGIVTSQRKQ